MKLDLLRAALIMFAFCAFTATTRLAARGDEAKKPTASELIFNGRDLSGWEDRGGVDWVVKNGEIVCKRMRVGPDLTFRAAKIPESFELDFDWKVVKNDKRQPAFMPDGGASLSFGATPLTTIQGAKRTISYQGEAIVAFRVDGGAIRISRDSMPIPEPRAYYSRAIRPDKPASRPMGQWNQGRIVWKEGLIQHWVNGDKVLEINLQKEFVDEHDRPMREGFAKMKAQPLHLSLDVSEGPVHFRNLTLKALPQ